MGRIRPDGVNLLGERAHRLPLRQHHHQLAREQDGLGAGEVLLTSVDQEGTRKGFDVDLVRAVAARIQVPIIASGGYGRPSDLALAVNPKYAEGLARGHARAAAYVAERFRQLGLHPAGDAGYYLQRVPLLRAIRRRDGAALVVHRDGRDHAFAFADQFLPAPDFNRAYSTVTAPAVFVGQGIQAPEAGLDDFAGLELREDCDTVLEPGMVVSMEPMITIPNHMAGAGGYREHDILVITEGGNRNITGFPYGPDHLIVKGKRKAAQ